MRRRNVLDDINKRGNGVVTESQKRDAERKSTISEGQKEAIEKGVDVPKEKGTAFAPATEAPLDINPADLKVETPQVNAANPTASVQPSAPTPVDVNNAQIAKTPSLVSQETREKYPDVTDSSQYLAWLRREEERDRDMQKAQLKREMWGSLGEGLGAIGDLYFSTKGAPLPTNKANVSDKMRERYTRMKAEADRDRHERMNNYLRILQQDRADKQADIEAEYKKGMVEWHKAELDEKRAKRNLDERKQDWLEQYQQGRLDIQKEINEINRKYKEGQITIADRNAQANWLRSNAAWLNAQNKGSGGSGGGGNRGTYGYTTTETYSYDRYGNKIGKTTTRTPSTQNTGKGSLLPKK